MEVSAALDYVRPRRNGVLVTLKRDGRPQLSNITYALGGDGLVRISVTSGRAKTVNARRDPRVSLHVTAEDFWSYVVIEGQASLLPDATDPSDATVEALVAYYQAVAGEHPDWDEYRAAMVNEGRTILTIAPERAYGMVGR